MPFDFSYTTKPDVFSLEGLRDWLRTQPGERSYNWHDCKGGCLLSTYLAARGANLIEDYVWLSSVKVAGEYVDLGGLACSSPHTYAAALARCEEAIAAGIRQPETEKVG